MGLIVTAGRWLLSFGAKRLLMGAAVTVAIAAAGTYVWSLKVDKESAEASEARAQVERDLALAASEANYQAFLSMSESALKAREALEAEHLKIRTRLAEQARLQNEVSNAKHEVTGCVVGNDDPVAPVLDLVLDRS